MISIRGYLQADKQNQDALLQLVQLLIDSIERHSVKGAPEELVRLRESNQEVLAALKSHAPPGELLGSAAHAMEALKHYNQNVVEYLQRPVIELRAKVKLLTEALTIVSGASSENIHRLRQVTGRMLSSLDVQEMRSLLRGRLSECLDGVLAESERRYAETGRASGQLDPGSQPPIPASSGVEASAADAATGLPSRGHAEQVIAQACQNEASAFVVVIVINQMQTVNRSFGRQFGDVLLQRFAVFVRQQLPTVDQLFRWSGPTVVALVRRKSALDVRVAIKCLLVQRLTVKTTECDVQVPVSTRWTVLPLMPSPRLLFHKMDAFADFE